MHKFICLGQNIAIAVNLYPVHAYKSRNYLKIKGKNNWSKSDQSVKWGAAMGDSPTYNQLTH